MWWVVLFACVASSSPLVMVNVLSSPQRFCITPDGCTETPVWLRHRLFHQAPGAEHYELFFIFPLVSEHTWAVQVLQPRLLFPGSELLDGAVLSQSGLSGPALRCLLPPVRSSVNQEEAASPELFVKRDTVYFYLFIFFGAPDWEVQMTANFCCSLDLCITVEVRLFPPICEPYVALVL